VKAGIFALVGWTLLIAGLSFSQGYIFIQSPGEQFAYVTTRFGADYVINVPGQAPLTYVDLGEVS